MLNDELCAKMRIKRSMTSAYHPQTNGLTERANQTAKVRLSKLAQNDGEWDEMVDSVGYSMRTQDQASTKFTPFFLMFGCNQNQFSELPGHTEPAVPLDDQEMTTVTLDESSGGTKTITEDPYAAIDQELLKQTILERESLQARIDEEVAANVKNPKRGTEEIL